MTEYAQTKDTPHLERYRPEDLKALIDNHPLAWVCADGLSQASLLPLIGLYDERHRLHALVGHFACRNPLKDAFQNCSSGTFLFTGPQGYISPSQAGRRNWGPTWNYAQARIEVDVSVDPAFTEEAVRLLVSHVEKDKIDPWSVEEMGTRYELLMPHIIGFRAKIMDVHAVFKLGQTEDVPTFNAIISNLENESLKDWMLRFDPDNRPLKNEHEYV
ncbi:MAG: FMN-binding negative transcriptional regulator [Pseudomonadota bacterium]